MFDVRRSSVSFSIRLAAFQASGAARVKLRQNGTVSFLIRLADFQARGVARVKLHQVKSEPQNIEYRMSKGGFASLSHFL